MMATINGRRVRLLKEEGMPIGIVREWREDSDWMKVVTDTGVSYMAHYTDPIEYIRPSGMGGRPFDQPHGYQNER